MVRRRLPAPHPVFSALARAHGDWVSTARLGCRNEHAAHQAIMRLRIKHGHRLIVADDTRPSRGYRLSPFGLALYHRLHWDPYVEIS